MTLCVCFDIDRTLVVQTKEMGVYNKYMSTLHPITIKVAGKNVSFQAINLIKTAEIFEALLRKGIQIAFVTNAPYSAEDFLPAFEHMYNLPKGSLQGCTFINRDKYAGEGVLKGDKMQMGRQDGLLPKDGDLVLVEDTEQHLVNAEAHGFKTVYAKGCLAKPGCDYSKDVDNSYLDQLIELCCLIMFSELAIQEPEIVNELTSPAKKHRLSIDAY